MKCKVCNKEIGGKAGSLTIHYAFKHNNIKREKTIKIEELREDIINDYLKGIKTFIICKKYRISMATLYKYLKIWGVPLHGNLYPPTWRGDLEEQREKIIQLYSGGYSCREIGKICNASSNAIKKHLKIWGVVRRDHREGCIARYLFPQEREKARVAQKEHWKDENFRRKAIEGMQRRSNDPIYLKNLSFSLKGKYCGELSANWHGGVSFEPYDSGFNGRTKAIIRNRDNYTCQLCGKREEELKDRYHKHLCIHHIDYNKRNTSLNNLLCLCRSCNTKVNSNRGYWKYYFKEMMNNGYA